MEYRNRHQGTHFENIVDVVVPDLYNKVDPGYGETLNKRKAQLVKLVAENKKRSRIYLPMLAAVIFAVLTVVALVIELIFGLGFQYALYTAVGALVAGIAVAFPVAKAEEAKRKEKEKAAVDAYERDKISFKANEYLYGVLQYTHILNLIMSNGTLTVFYMSTNDKPKCDVFKYEEWKGDEDLPTPFLVFENSRLYGRSSLLAESTTFTTNIIGN